MVRQPLFEILIIIFSRVIWETLDNGISCRTWFDFDDNYQMWKKVAAKLIINLSS